MIFDYLDDVFVNDSCFRNIRQAVLTVPPRLFVARIHRHDIRSSVHVLLQEVTAWPGEKKRKKRKRKGKKSFVNRCSTKQTYNLNA